MHALGEAELQRGMELFNGRNTGEMIAALTTQ